MNRISRLLSGALFGGALLAVVAVTPKNASAYGMAEPEYVVGCDGNICCTYDKATGELKSCIKVS